MARKWHFYFSLIEKVEESLRKKHGLTKQMTVTLGCSREEFAWLEGEEGSSAVIEVAPEVERLRLGTSKYFICNLCWLLLIFVFAPT